MKIVNSGAALRPLVNAVLLVAVAVLFTACQTTNREPSTVENFEAILEEWVGASEQEFLYAWGVPDDSYDAGDTQYLVYDHQGGQTTTGKGPGYVTNWIGDTAFTSSSGGASYQTTNRVCRVTFALIDGRVDGWSHRGNWCVASPD